MCVFLVCVCVCVPNLPQVVKVVFPPIPAVSRLQTLRFIGDVAHIEPVAREKLSFKQLDTQKDVSTKISKKRSQSQDHTAAFGKSLRTVNRPDCNSHPRRPCTNSSRLS